MRTEDFMLLTTQINVLIRQSRRVNSKSTIDPNNEWTSSIFSSISTTNDFFEELEDNNYSFQIFKPFKLKKVKPEFQK